MIVGLKILPRKEVLDSQGRAVEQTLKAHGFDLTQCRVGKYIEIEVEALDKNEAHQKIKAMADFVLYNPLIESYELI